MAPELHRRVSEEVHVVATAQAVTPSEWTTLAAPEAASSVEELVAEIVRGDHQYRLARGELHLAGVQLTEARREILPRLMARGFFEMPNSESGVDTVFSGGLYLRFDLIRACLSHNAVTMAQVTQAARLEKCRAAGAAATFSFFNSMSHLEAMLQAEEHNQAFSQLAVQAADEAEAVFKAGRGSSDHWQVWVQRRAEKELEQQRLAARLKKTRAETALARRGATVDETKLLELTETFLNRLATTNPPPLLVESLEEAPAVVEAKLNLFVAEVGILDAKLKRLPAVSLDVGAGQIPVQGDRWQKENGIVPMVEVTVPLLDMGDISRGIKRAKITAGQARERMIQAVETSRLNIESTRDLLAVAAAAVTAVEGFRDASAARLEETKAMARAGTAASLDAREAAWRLIEAEAALDQARLDFRLALLAERAACGALLDESLQDEVFSQLESQDGPDAK
jgi:hypothetical protein